MFVSDGVYNDHDIIQNLVEGSLKNVLPCCQRGIVIFEYLFVATPNIEVSLYRGIPIYRERCLYRGILEYPYIEVAQYR